MTFNRANPAFMINFPEELLIKIMESIEKAGYDFYSLKVLNNAFKNAVKQRCLVE